MMRWWRRRFTPGDRGSGMIEYVGLGVVVAGIVVAVAATGSLTGIASSVGGAVCRVASNCAGSGTEAETSDMPTIKRSPVVECFRAPCFPPDPRPRPTIKRSPVVECFRAPCYPPDPRPRPTPKFPEVVCPIKPPCFTVSPDPTLHYTSPPESDRP